MAQESRRRKKKVRDTIKKILEDKDVRETLKEIVLEIVRRILNSRK